MWDAEPTHKHVKHAMKKDVDIWTHQKTRNKLVNVRRLLFIKWINTNDIPLKHRRTLVSLKITRPLTNV